MADSFAARVRRGAEVLDNTVNDKWWLKIDLDSLELRDGEHCMLGQLSEDGDYCQGLGMIGLDCATDKDVDLGFNLPEVDVPGLSWREAEKARHRGWRWLNIRWRQEILRRRQAKEATDA